MRIPALGETDLLVPLHEGMFEQPMWQTFLSRLRSVTGAEAAVLVFQPRDRDAVIELHASSLDQTSPGRLFAGKAGAGQLLSRHMRQGRVYSLEELASLGADAAQRFCKEHLQPSGFVHLRAMRVACPDGPDVWLNVLSRTPLGAAVGNLFSALTPHLLVALRVFAALERERSRSSMQADVFRRMNFGWMSIDRNCRIVDLDAQAERVLQQSGLLRRGPYNRLMPAAPALDRVLTDVVKAFAENPLARPRAIQLSRDPWVDLLVAPLQAKAASPESQPVAVIYISGDRTPTADRHEQLADLFHLTASEARLAWSMAQGLSIAEAAQDQGLTIETARNYSKKIYAKTGARGQVELVRHILTSVLALA